MAPSATSERSTCRRIGQYRKRVNELFAPLFAASEPLRTKLTRILNTALDLYLSGGGGPRGCFTVLSAASEAIADADLHGLVSDAIEATDRAFERLFADARAAGELPADADPQRLARVASGTLHTLSIRARARIPRGIAGCRSSTMRLRRSAELKAAASGGSGRTLFWAGVELPARKARFAA